MTRADDLETLLDEVGLVGDVGHSLLVVTGVPVDEVLATIGASPLTTAATIPRVIRLPWLWR